jgi:hypothetical protein
VLGIELNNVQLLSSKVEVSEISAFLQTTTTTTLPAAVAAPTNRRAVASLDYVGTASKLQVNPKHIFLPRFNMSVMQILSN